MNLIEPPDRSRPTSMPENVVARCALFGSRFAVESLDPKIEYSTGPRTAPRPAATCPVLYVPPSTVRFTCGVAPAGRTVKIWITLAIASDPKSAECDPRRTSIRSMFSGERLAKLKTPPGSLSGMPSMSTLLWLDSPPRTHSDVKLPTPPDRAAITPGTVRSRSMVLSGLRCSICARVRTVIDAPTWDTGSSFAGGRHDN